MKFLKSVLTAASLLAATTGCDHLIDNRIPALPVYINISGHGMWNSWGVDAYGQSRDFILIDKTRLPSGFPYGQTSATGYGGVMLIMGIDPFSNEMTPLAYDLSCPVEKSRTIRVAIDPETNEAVCPKCHSRYNVTERGGSPTAGQALTDHYQLKMYVCLQPADMSGGYIVTSR